MKIIKLHTKTLEDLNIKENSKITKILLKGLKRRRFLDLGFVKGTTISVINKAPSGNPVAYLVKGAIIAIRNEDAKKILVDEKYYKES